MDKETENVVQAQKSRKERFRRHTKQERKQEKRRYRARKREEKRKTHNGRPELKEPEKESRIKTSSQLSRGAVLVEMAKKKVELQQLVIAPAPCKPPSKRIRLEAAPVQSSAKPAKTPIQRIPRVRREDLRDGTSVGNGSFGECRKMTYRGNLPVVVKEFRPHVSKGDVVSEAEVIVELQRSGHHPCLPLIIGIDVALKPYILVTQFCGRDNVSYTVADAFSESLFTSVREWATALESLSRTLSFMHSKKWLHNDLKHNNVVCHFADNKWNLVLIDFGKSTIFQNAKIVEKKKDPSKYPWLAPEVCLGQKPPSIASDVFSMGFVIKFVSKRLKIAELYSSELHQLSIHCLKKVPSDRPSTQHISKCLMNLK